MITKSPTRASSRRVEEEEFIGPETWKNSAKSWGSIARPGQQSVGPRSLPFA
jgi:hypothetical protein